MKIEFYRKSVYGNENIYIVDNELAGTVKSLTGKKTINNSDIKSLESLGCVFSEVIAPRQ